MLAGCGGDDKKDKGPDLTALRCPQAASGSGNAGDSFDTAELVGKQVDEARARAAEHDCTVVVAMKDGTSVPVPVDIDPKRIHVYTKSGVVTEIESVGGGL